jgi:hypothetical protein
MLIFPILTIRRKRKKKNAVPADVAMERSVSKAQEAVLVVQRHVPVHPVVIRPYAATLPLPLLKKLANPSEAIPPELQLLMCLFQLPT